MDESTPIDGSFADWISTAHTRGAADLHVVANHPPTIRIHGDLVPLSDRCLHSDEAKAVLQTVCNSEQWATFLAQKNLDFAASVRGSTENQEFVHRFRANLFWSGQQAGGCFRIIPQHIPRLDWAGFPHNLAKRLAGLRNGLVLISGVAGSGKTTSLAMIIDLMIRQGGHRIVTIEDPIEYLFPANAGSIITQREVGVDVATFADGLKFGLRQDPDVILVGEIRDRETAQMALSAAETGHLVFSTLHTRDAKGVISRFADLFPQSVQPEVRSQLALSLRAVVAQHLLPSIISGSKRELALEVMLNSSPIAAAIRLAKLESIDNYLLSGRTEGMQSLDEAVRQLLADGKIARETAERFVSDPRFLRF